MAFDNYVSPALPLAPKEYNYSYFNQFVRSVISFMKINDSRTGINSTSITGDILNLPVQEYTAVNGTNNNVGFPAATFVRVSGPSAAFTITGVASAAYNGAAGRLLYIFNSTSQNMTIANESASSSAANRIITGSGADIVTTGTGTIQMIYSPPDSRWVVIATRL